MRCQGHASSTGSQCRKTAVKDLKYCHLHVRCQGIKADGTACGSRAWRKFEYLYCRKEHVRNVHTKDVAHLRVENLRSLRLSSVLELRNETDAYTGSPTKTPQRGILAGLEMDHVVELHTGRDVFDHLNIGTGVGIRNKRRVLLENVKDAFNEPHNLNLTSKQVNHLKFKGISAFQQDYYNPFAMGVVEGDLTHYMLQARWNETVDGKSKKLTRRETASICKELRDSHDKIAESFPTEKPYHEEFMMELHDLFVSMRIF